MNDLELCALRAVIDYLWKDERRDYEAEPVTGHIFLELVILKEYLKRGAL